MANGGDFVAPEVLVTPHIRHDGTWHLPINRHRWAEIDLVTAGACDLWLADGERLALRTGDAFALPADIPHGFAAAPGGCAFCVVHVNGLREALLQRLTPGGRAGRYPLSPAGCLAFADAARAMQRELASGDELAADVALAKVIEIVALVCREAGRAPGDGPRAAGGGRHYVDQTLALLDRGAITTWDVHSLAASLHLSAPHLRLLFRRHLGVPPKVYLQQRRLVMAKGLLLETDLPVATIARRLGFAAPHHFSAAFAHAEGLPPSAWRRRFAISTPSP